MDHSNDEDNFDRLRKQRIVYNTLDGWREELKQFRSDPSVGVTKDMDTIEWWRVRIFLMCSFFIALY